jgi:1,2-diacylglycerol 3-alpha-glucosyltransferase
MVGNIAAPDETTPLGAAAVRPRFAVMFDNFGPYHMDRLASLRDHGDVIAVEASPARSEYAWIKPQLPEGVEYAPFVLTIAEMVDPASIERELERLLAARLPDGIAVPGWSSLAALVATRWATRRKIRVVGMSDTNAYDEPRRAVTEAVKRMVVSHYSGGFTGSRSQADYLSSLGAPRDAIETGYDVVANAYFASRAAIVRSAGGMPAMGGDTLSEPMRGRYFLGVSRFVAKKNLPALVRAYGAFRQGRGDDPADWPLVLLGDGEERGAIEAEIERLGLRAHVLLPGFFQIDRLPEFYATAGAFVHASTTEQWGLVVNEAMASGLPVAVSRRCGCVEELVEDGVTGIVFDPFDDTAITAALHAATTLPDRAGLIERASARIARWDVDRFGAGLAAAARSAAQHPPVRPGPLARAGLALAIARRRRELVAALAGNS